MEPVVMCIYTLMIHQCNSVQGWANYANENECDQLVLASLCPPLGTLPCNPAVIQFHGWGRLSTLPAVTLTGQGNPTLLCNVTAIELR